MSRAAAFYNATVMDHFTNPRNVGEVKDADAVGEAAHLGDGDRLRLSLRIREGRIEEARFRAMGCPAAIASSSVATELITGRSVREARRFTNEEVVAALGGLPEKKIQCSVLASQALGAALADYDKKLGVLGRGAAVR